MRLRIAAFSTVTVVSLCLNSAILHAQAIIDRIDVPPAMSRSELITKTAGDVTDNALTNYGDDFAAYWANSAVSREGKVFEAVVADTFNSRSAATARTASQQLVPTAALRQPGNPADLYRIDRSGKILGRVQAKLGFQDLVRGLQDPKYANMDFVTPAETLDELRGAVAKEVEKAARRGIPLDPKWQAAKDAIKSNRVWSKLPCGAPLPQRAYVAKVAKDHYQAMYAARHASYKAAKAAASVADDVTEASSSATVKVANPANQVADDVVKTAASTADDIVRPVTKFVAKWAGVAGVLFEVGRQGYQSYKAELAFADGQITPQQREVKHAQHAGAAVGVLGGGAGGFWAGSQLGTWVSPGWGTLIGGVGGAIGGALAGERVVSDVSGKAMNAVHRHGTTVAEIAERGMAISAELGQAALESTRMYALHAATSAAETAGTAWASTAETVVYTSQEVVAYSSAVSTVIGDAVVATERSAGVWAHAAAKATGDTVSYVSKEASPILAEAQRRLGETAEITTEAVSSATTEAIDYVSTNGAPLVEEAGRQISNAATKAGEAAKSYYGRVIDYWQVK